MEKGGCNSVPIDKDIDFEGEQLIIDVGTVDVVAYLF